ncbi:NRT1/ PTR FAMILY 8.2-like, partial [Thalictrum thalictroides]
NEVAERFAFYAIVVNMVAYLFFEMHQSLPNAATHVTDWIGAAFVLALLGALVADAYLSRFKAIITFSCIYTVGMVLLTLSAALDDLRPPPCICRFLDKAAVITDHEASTTNRWRLCTVTQIEEFKSSIIILPIWASTIALSLLLLKCPPSSSAKQPS